MLDEILTDKETVLTEKTREQKLREVFHLENLEEHLYDEDYLVRFAVAETGYGLEVLIHDPEPVVRRQVAAMGYGLHVLKNDSDEWVRCKVASQGYALEELKEDKSRHVQDTALRVSLELAQKSECLDEKIKRFQTRCHVEKSPDTRVTVLSNAR